MKLRRLQREKGVDLVSVPVTLADTGCDALPVFQYEITAALPLRLLRSASAAFVFPPSSSLYSFPSGNRTPKFAVQIVTGQVPGDDVPFVSGPHAARAASKSVPVKV
jgi:hypothetical protein